MPEDEAIGTITGFDQETLKRGSDRVVALVWYYNLFETAMVAGEKGSRSPSPGEGRTCQIA